MNRIRLMIVVILHSGIQDIAPIKVDTHTLRITVFLDTLNPTL